MIEQSSIELALVGSTQQDKGQFSRQQSSTSEEVKQAEWLEGVLALAEPLPCGWIAIGTKNFEVFDLYTLSQALEIRTNPTRVDEKRNRNVKALPVEPLVDVGWLEYLQFISLCKTKLNMCFPGARLMTGLGAFSCHLRHSLLARGRAEVASGTH